MAQGGVSLLLELSALKSESYHIRDYQTPA